MVSAKSNNLPDYFTKSANLNGRDVSDSGFVVNAATFLEVVVSARGATIEGKVVDETGKPVAYATIVDIPAEHRTRTSIVLKVINSDSGAQ